MRDKRDISTKVIEAFLDLCLEVGVLNVTLQKAAKRAKVPFASAHYHWGGKKNDLVTAAITQVGASAQDYITRYLEAATIRGENPIQAYVQGTFEWIRTCPREAHFWLYSYYHVSSRTKDVGVGKAFISTARMRVERLIFEAVGKSFYPPVRNAKEIAASIHSIVLGNGILAVSFRNEVLGKSLEEETLRSVELLLTSKVS